MNSIFPGRVTGDLAIGIHSHLVCGKTAIKQRDPETRGQFERAVRAQTKEYFVSPRSAAVPPERLFAESRKEFALFWAEYIHVAETKQREALSQVPAVEAPRLPRMINEDGDEILITTMHFRITDKSCLRPRLAGLKSFIYDKDGDSWTWLKAKSRLDPDALRRMLGLLPKVN